MNINVTLFNAIRNELSYYDCDDESVRSLLLHEGCFSERQAKAIAIVEKAFESHKKGEFSLPMVKLARIESGVRDVEPRLRDHVVHATLSFFLGIYISKEFLRLQKGIHVDRFQWKLAGLLHDISYPIEFGSNVITSLSEETNKIEENSGSPASSVHFEINPRHLTDLTNRANALKLIQDCLDNWNLEIKVKNEYQKMIRSGRICHGILSSLTILHIIDAMYQKHNPKKTYLDEIWHGIKSSLTKLHRIYAMHQEHNPKREDDDVDVDSSSWKRDYLKEDIVPACSAIFIHNLPKRCFARKKIDFHEAPLAFLLRVSDSLQEWERQQE